jgi:ATP-dependent Zn protease
MLRRCETHARAIVTLEWKRITKVAEALVRHRELTGEQVQDLLWVKKE